MLKSIRFLLGSSRKLFVAVILFIVLDLSVLAINLWIAHKVAQDAVVINLAGRQRMLTQRITKSSILMTTGPAGADRQGSQQELVQAFGLFEKTLHAFDQGGATQGGDGQPVRLSQVKAPDARASLQRTLALIEPIQADMQALRRQGRLPEDRQRHIRDYMVRNNLEMLGLMNRLTTSMEHDSVRRIGVLRMVQTGAFLLALCNFIVILMGMVKRQRDAERASLQWEEAAQRDVLTGLYNRLAFDRRFERALEQARAANSTLALLVIDLDGFKPVNDRHGHAMGDLVLQRIAQVLQGVARESDTVARLGGDEFAVLCQNLHEPQALTDLCQRIFQRMEEFTDVAPVVSVRASIGVAVFPGDGTEASVLIAAADRAMYGSKQQGGQRVTFACDTRKSALDRREISP